MSINSLSIEIIICWVCANALERDTCEFSTKHESRTYTSFMIHVEFEHSIKLIFYELLNLTKVTIFKFKLGQYSNTSFNFRFCLVK